MTHRVNNHMHADRYNKWLQKRRDALDVFVPLDLRRQGKEKYHNNCIYGTIQMFLTATKLVYDKSDR